MQCSTILLAKTQCFESARTTTQIATPMQQLRNSAMATLPSSLTNLGHSTSSVGTKITVSKMRSWLWLSWQIGTKTALEPLHLLHLLAKRLHLLHQGLSRVTRLQLPKVIKSLLHLLAVLLQSSSVLLDPLEQLLHIHQFYCSNSPHCLFEPFGQFPFSLFLLF